MVLSHRRSAQAILACTVVVGGCGVAADNPGSNQATPAPTASAEPDTNADTPNLAAPFDRARELLPSANFSYTPEQTADISTAAAVLMQECLAAHGHEVTLEHLGATDIAAVQADWSDAVHGIEFADRERVASSGYNHWRVDANIDDRADTVASEQDVGSTVDEALNALGGCRDQAYETLGVAELGVLAAGPPTEVIEFESNTLRPLKHGSSLEPEWAAWSSCMAASGYADIDRRAPLPDVDVGHAQALADVECRGETGLRSALVAAHRDAVVEALKRFTDLHAGGAATRASEAERAREILEQRAMATTS